MTITLLIIIILAVLVTVSMGVRTVPQGEEWVAERFGKYLRTLPAGLHFIVPFFDKIAYRVTTKDIVMDIERQEVITRDNAVIHANAVAFLKIIDPGASVYGVEDFQRGVRNLVQTSLRSIIGAMDLDEALSSREKIKSALRESLSEEMGDWGITLKSVEIQDIQPSGSMQKAMEQQAAAVRERKATVTRAEGAKQAAILEAEGRLESARRDAEAEVTLAGASAKAIGLVKGAAGAQVTPLMYLLGQRYMESLDRLAQSNNGKFILLPADIQETVKGLLSSIKR